MPLQGFYSTPARFRYCFLQLADSLTGFICEDGKRVNGEAIIQSIASMNERSNGLGGGFAAYGIYPEMRDLYALHLMYDETSTKEETERILNESLFVELKEEIPTRKRPGGRRF